MSTQAELREKQFQFNSPIACAPDFAYWGKVDYWTIDEGIALILGRAPEHATWPQIQSCVRVSTFAEKFARIREMAMRAAQVSQGRFGASNLAKFFIQWAKTKELDVPSALEAEVAKHAGDLIDWRTVAEQRENRIAELEARISQLEAAPERWPWGGHSTPNLEALAAAGQRFWTNYDPSDPTTASTNEVVAEWLMTEQGVGQRVAEIMAQILRDPAIRTGPR